MQSEKKTRLINKYRRQAVHDARFTPASETEVNEKILPKYYKHARNNGFTTNFNEAISENLMFFTPQQRKIAEAIIKSVFMKLGNTINISITRQFGKTEIVSQIIDFCYIEHYNFFHRPFSIAVIAPEQKTAKRVMNRISGYLQQRGHEYAVDNADIKQTVRGDRLCLFGIYEGSKYTTAEGETMDLIVRDEAHKGDDEAFSDQVAPMVTRTDGTIIFIGNGSIGACQFTENLKAGNRERNLVFRYTYNTLKPYMLGLAGKGLRSAGSWIAGQEKYIRENGGNDSWFVRKNVYCEEITNFQQFMTEAQILRCGIDMEKKMALYKTYEKMPKLYLAVDFGHSYDQTVATFLNDERVIENWFIPRKEGEVMTLRGQCELIREFSDEMGYTQRLASIGGDSTGLGIGAVEFLSIEFGCDIINFNFNAKSKHLWYLDLRDVLTSSYEEDLIKYDRNHPYAEMFIKQCINMEVTQLKNGFLAFHAKSGQGNFDDMLDSLVIGNNMRMERHGAYKNLKPKHKRIKSLFMDDKKRQKIDRELSSCVMDMYAPSFMR